MYLNLETFFSVNVTEKKLVNYSISLAYKLLLCIKRLSYNNVTSKLLSRDRAPWD